MPCPCGSDLPLARCCGQYHGGALHLQAPDARTLMRSRYSAYVLQNHDYLLQTWHPSTRPLAIEPDPPGHRWLGLQVLRWADTDDGHAEVAFAARHRSGGGRALRLLECSRFVREHGRWLYLDADGSLGTDAR
jgi:SEC-C motif-containing protein